MVKKLVIALVALVAAGVGYVALQPAAFHYERSTTITAPPEVVFGLVEDFHNWDKWSPWKEMDPSQASTYTGAPKGVGAITEWSGDEVGAGRMTILDAKQNESIKIKLEFIRPFEATNAAGFRFTPEGKDVKVVWTMDGEKNFASKLAGVFMDMKSMIEADFDKGLAKMKAEAEAEATRRAEEARRAAEAAQALAAKAAELAAQAQAAATAAAAAAPVPPAPATP